MLPPAWTSRIARASSSPCEIRSFNRYASPLWPLAEQRDRVLLVVVRGQHHDAGVRMAFADRVRAIDPLELERGRHLDVRDDDVGHVFGRGLQQRRRVCGHADDLDVVVGVEERPDALADQDVVLAQDHSDAHAAYPVPSRPPCTIRA